MMDANTTRTSVHEAISTDLRGVERWPLDEFGVIRVEGAQASDFLQAQLTNDIATVSESTPQIAAWLNAQGRVQMACIVYAWKAGYLLVTTKADVERFIADVSRYVLRTKVRLTDESHSLATLALAEPPASLPPLPPMQAHASDDWIVHHLGLPGGDSVGYLAIGHDGEVIETSGTGHDAARSSWTSRLVRAGLPLFETDRLAQYTPHMLNLDLVGGVSFTKGCYPGQEIVARTQYLGRLKRRMYHYSTDYEGRLDSGDELRALTPADARIGSVLMAETPEDKGARHLLAVVQMAQAGSPAMVISADGEAHPVRLEPLPYPVAEPQG